MMFDSNLAWQRASATIRANREVFMALAGAFFLLPTLALTLLFPQPAPPPGASEAALMQFAMDYYTETMPVAISRRSCCWALSSGWLRWSWLAALRSAGRRR
jgi:hypothetical protein